MLEGISRREKPAHERNGQSRKGEVGSFEGFTGRQ